MWVRDVLKMAPSLQMDGHYKVLNGPVRWPRLGPVGGFENVAPGRAD
jgi:hypothetical protein